MARSWWTIAGSRSKHFHVKDGGGIALWRKAGKKVAIISGRSAACVDVRAAELGITPVIQGAADKRGPFLGLLREFGLEARQVCAIGDDLADLPDVLAWRASRPARADAASEVVEAAHLVSASTGGRGAVREVIEAILKRQGAWDGLVEGYRSVRADPSVILEWAAQT